MVFNKIKKKNTKKSDLDSAIFCYRNKQYKACAMLIFCLIDSLLIKRQSKDQWRKVGLNAIKKLNEKFEEKLSSRSLFIIGLYNTNLKTCLETIFAQGKNFVKEPSIINRNFISHGMNTRVVRKRDCTQLFIVLHNLLYFLDRL